MLVFSFYIRSSNIIFSGCWNKLHHKTIYTSSTNIFNLLKNTKHKQESNGSQIEKKDELEAYLCER